VTAEYPSILLTFAAGFLSFFSPCVLPLLPSYLGILGSTGGVVISSIDDRATEKKRLILLKISVCFVLGFTLVFIVLSIIMTTTFMLMGGITKYIRMGAGIIVLLFGINIFFDFISILNYEKRFSVNSNRKGMLGAFVTGMAFGTGWTPCIGPILTSVLFLAAGQGGSIGSAVAYLLIYSVGLGVPFLLSALFFDRYIVPAKWFRNKLPIIKKISAIVLIIMGLFLLTGHFTEFSKVFTRLQFQYIGWAEDKGYFFRLIANWLTFINK